MHSSSHYGLLGEVGYLPAELAARHHRPGHQLPAFHDGAFVVRADAVVTTDTASAEAGYDNGGCELSCCGPWGKAETKAIA